MSRPIRGILLLIMIFIAASGMPLYADTMNFNFEFDFTKTFPTSKPNSIAVDTNVTMLSSSHPQLEISITADKKNLPLQFNPDNPVELSLYSQDIMVNIPTPENIDIIISHNETTTVLIDLHQKLLNIPNGDYQLKVKLNIENLTNEIVTDKIPISFHTDAVYLPPLETINRNQTALTLYFPDNNMKYLIPITRIIPYTRTPLRSTIDHLALGPKETLGLPLGSPIPVVERLGLNRGIANVYLPKDIGKYDSESTTARIAFDSIVNSLSAIKEVNGVQFYFDNKIIDFSFHGITVDKPIYLEASPKFFVGNITDTNRTLLTPVPITILNPSIEYIFKGLKYSGQLILYNYNLQPTLPEEVTLLDYSIKDNHLTLKFNEEFLNAYADYPNSRKLMIDSLLYTFTSLEGIDSVEFQVEGITSNFFKGIPLNQPLIPSPYINPEEL